MALPGTPTRHMINRFSYGYSTSQHKAVTAAGGPQRWFEAQLRPGKISDKTADGYDTWFPYFRSSAQRRFDADQRGKHNSWEQAMDLVRWTILRRMISKRQLFEVMVDFWSNLLHVPDYSDGWMWRNSYDRTIRKYALSTFADLLTNATLHPAMQVYLNSAGSTKDSVNENHGRELLELHSVGLGSGYTEDMVKDSAKILTGYDVGTWEKIKRVYHPDDHYVGRVRVLGFSHANADDDGRPVMRAYLRYLALHPATARRIATRLCRRFVSDTPSTAIVDAVTRAYTESDSDIKACLRVLAAHPDFAASVDAKTRTPGQDAISTYRAMGLKPTKPKRGDYFGRTVNYVLNEMGESPFGWPAPNGFPEPAAAWASVGRIRGSWNMHLSTAGRWWPSKGFSRPAARHYLPAAPVRLDRATDAVARRLLGRPASAATISAVGQVLDLDPSTTIRSIDRFGDWQATLLIATVFNSPEHLRR